MKPVIISKIVNTIYDLQEGKYVRPAVYQDEPGVTSCFIFNRRHKGRVRPEAVQLIRFARKINGLVKKQLKLPGWTYDDTVHVPHVTATSIIDPIQKQSVPEGKPELLMLQSSLLKTFKSLAASLGRFQFTFDRLHLGSNGTLTAVGYPSTPQIGVFRETAFHLFKSDRWWHAEQPNGKWVPDPSAACVIGAIKPRTARPQPLVKCDLDAARRTISSIFFQPIKIKVTGIWVIQYTNRLINPKSHVTWAEWVKIP